MNYDPTPTTITFQYNELCKWFKTFLSVYLCYSFVWTAFFSLFQFKLKIIYWFSVNQFLFYSCFFSFDYIVQCRILIKIKWMTLAIFRYCVDLRWKYVELIYWIFRVIFVFGLIVGGWMEIDTNKLLSRRMACNGEYSWHCRCYIYNIDQQKEHGLSATNQLQSTWP